MKKIDQIISNRYQADATRWFCSDCARDHSYLGEIGGAKQNCEGCGKFTMTYLCKWLVNRDILTPGKTKP